MKLPNADKAIVEIEKFTEYALNPEHPTGRHKARVFKSALGLTLKDAHFLQSTVQQIVMSHEALAENPTPYGERYVIDFDLTTQGNSEGTQHLDDPSWGEFSAPDELLCDLGWQVMNLYDVVALLEDLPAEGLKRGQVGTIIEAWQPQVYEVEFADPQGITYAMVALRADQLMTLYWHPAQSKQTV